VSEKTAPLLRVDGLVKEFGFRRSVRDRVARREAGSHRAVD